MSGGGTERFQRLSELFEGARQRPAAERPQWLQDACDDPTLRAEVERLLRHHDAAERAGDLLIDAGTELRRSVGGRPMRTLPARIGRFVVLGELARGGMGIVLRGEDRELDREVALKIVQPELGDDPGLAERLRTEARIAGRLQHPGIVPVYELGSDGSQPFVAMKVVEGRTLAEMLRARPDPATDRPRLITVFESLCQAIAYAHARGVVHRDLKPHNVMVGAFGEVQVMDWGLAEFVGDASDPRPSSAAGTPAYMAPEQARGQSHADPRADVFGLGAILCEILTGTPPFAADSGSDSLALARRGDLQATFEALERCGADPDLVTLCRRCLAADPESRPATADEVARATRRHLESLSERARSAELAAAAADARADAERRSRRLTTVLGVVVVAVVIVGFAIAFALREAERERLRVHDERMRNAIGEAQSLEATAEGIDDVAHWEAALAAAKNAESLIVPDTSAARAAEARHLVGELTDRVADRRFAERLDELVAGSQVQAGTDRAQARALEATFRARLGGSVDDLPVAAIADDLRGSHYRQRVLAALDLWMLLELRFDLQSPRADKLRRIADAVDNDPLQRSVRLAAQHLDRDRLVALAHSSELAAASPRVQWMVGLHLDFVGQLDLGCSILERAHRQDPSDVDINFELATANMVASRYDEALRYATAAVALRPRSAAAQALIAEVYRWKKEHGLAIQHARRAIELQPDDGAGWLTLSLEEMHAGDAAAAATAAQHALQILTPEDSTFPIAATCLGDARIAMGDVAEAVDAYLTAVGSPRLDLQDPAWSLTVPAHRQVAAELAARHAARPGDPAVRYLLAHLQEDAGDLAGALAGYEAIEATHPGFGQAAQQIHRLRATLGDLLLTYRSIDAAVQRLPADEDVLAAWPRLRAAIERGGPAGREARLAYAEGRLQERAGHLDEAASHLREAVAADRSAVEPWRTLWSVLARDQGETRAATEIRALLAAGVPPTDPLNLPPLQPQPITPVAGAVVDGAMAVELVASPFAAAEPTAQQTAAEWQVFAGATDDPHAMVVDVVVSGDRPAFVLPAGLLEAGRDYGWRMRDLAGDAPPSVWSEVARIHAQDAGPSALPIDLTGELDVDVVADPGDDAEDAFDDFNGFSLVLDGFDGERTGRADVQGMPADRRIGVHRLADYHGPNARRLGSSSPSPVHLSLPRRRMVALRLLVSAANGTARLPARVIYEDGTSDRCAIVLPDWFTAGKPDGLGCDTPGVPVWAGMDRLGRTGVEERNAATLFEVLVPVDPTRQPVSLMIDPAHGSYGAINTRGLLFALTAMVLPE